MSDLIERVCSWMVAIANDNSHGYSQDQKKRWLSPDIDCSSFVILAWESQGIPVKSKGGALNTFTMKKAFEACGFQCIKYSKDLPLLRGDVLLNEQHHTVLYLGNNQIVHASSSETGGKYGKDGDQTEGEVCVRSFYQPSYGWQYILRYPENTKTRNPYPVPTTTLKKGMVGLQISWLQQELRESGADIQIDQHFGPATENALKRFQRLYGHGLAVDGICGSATRSALLENTTILEDTKPVNPYKHLQITLKKGSKGESVKWLQWELNHRINAELVEDGSFGNATRQKVIEFQKIAFPNQPAEWDGIVGKKTRERLES